MRKFVEACHDRDIVLAVITRRAHGGPAPSPPAEIQSLLKEFSDLNLEKLPHALPPMRSI